MCEESDDTAPSNLVSVCPIIMVLYVFGSMGSPPLCIGATVFMVHCGGKPSERARLNIRARKGARNSRAYMMCSACNLVWFMDFLCCSFFMTFGTLEVMKSVPLLGQGVEGIGTLGGWFGTW